MKTLLAILFCGLNGFSPAADKPAKVTPGKPCIYKTSAGKERQMEIYFPPNHDPAKAKVPGFFNKEPWRTVTLIAADKFLVKQGLLTGEPTLQAPATGETLTTAPEE